MLRCEWGALCGRPSGITTSDWLRLGYMHPPTRPPVYSHFGLHSLLEGFVEMQIGGPYVRGSK